MTVLELILVSVSLSMDAFAAAICQGLSLKQMKWKKALMVGLYFGGFQAVMPLIGYFLGTQFEDKITKIDHWIAFALLAFIGVSMLREALDKEQATCPVNKPKSLLILAIATSIDALAVGITFGFLQVNITLAASLIGIITFTLSVVGVKIGNAFGDKYKSKAELAGGIILILIGLKILLQHLGVL